MTSPKLSASLGLTGLAGRGTGLARTLVRHGHRVAVHDHALDRMTALVDGHAAEGAFVGSQSLAELVAAVQQPRTLFLTLDSAAAAATDAVLDELLPLLDAGDLVVDAGDAHIGDTTRRGRTLAASGLLFAGAGLSGGHEEALHGAAITVGGPAAAYGRLGPILEPVADLVDGRACCAHVGSGASGHFAALAREAVTVVQAAVLAEGGRLLRSLSADPAAALPLPEGATSSPGGAGEVSEVRAQWALQGAARLGAPLTGLPEALLERRRETAGPPPGAAALVREPLASSGPDLPVEDLTAAVEAAGRVAQAQAFDLVRAGSDAYGWGVDLAAVATAWRGGRRVLPAPLDPVEQAYAEQPGLETLLSAPHVAEEVASRLASWRRVVSAAVASGVPVPVTSALLGYVDGLVRGTG